MNQRDDLDRLLTAWLDDPFTPPAPRYLPEVLERTRHSRQRRPWASLERWLPMTIILRQPLLAPPLRALAIGTALLLALVASMALLPVLSSPTPLPALVVTDHPQGLVAYESGGDVWVGDPATGESHVLIKDGLQPSWSPDGAHLVFWRTAGGRDMPMITDAAGTEPMALLDKGLFFASGLSWSPASDAVAVSSTVGGRSQTDIIAIDGTGATDGPRLPESSVDAPAASAMPGRQMGTGCSWWIRSASLALLGCRSRPREPPGWSTPRPGR